MKYQVTLCTQTEYDVIVDADCFVDAITRAKSTQTVQDVEAAIVKYVPDILPDQFMNDINTVPHGVFLLS